MNKDDEITSAAALVKLCAPEKLRPLLQSGCKGRLPERCSRQPTGPWMIQVVEYNSLWLAQFEQIRRELSSNLIDLAIAIEHVGSTAVPGLAAKPVIDIDVVIESKERLESVIPRLGQLNYEYQGDLGIQNREAFRAPQGYAPHHLYVCLQGSTALRNHLVFRDHLRSDVADRQAYASLKQRLASHYPEDRNRYVQGKTEFVLRILSQHGFDDAELNAIRQFSK